MTPKEIQACMQVGLDAALEAGPIALEYFRKPMEVEDKLPGLHYDPVTEADKRIETLIRERLSAKFPEHRIVGEEHPDQGEGDTYWIVDPIDGTRAFISGMPVWGTLLGLVVDGRAVAGLMHQPFTGETWIADPVSGARFLHHGEDTPLRVRSGATLADAILYSTYPLFEPEVFKRFRDLMAKCRLHRWGGDCYGFALLAHGTIDLMIDAHLNPYDIVALIPIIEGAGGVVTDLDGNSPIDGGTVVAAANESLHAAALEIMNQTAAS